MELLILLIVLIILMPGLLGFILVPLLLAIGIILLVQLLFHSVATVLLVPRSLLWVAFNKRVRQNHALEHATVNVIEEKFGRTNLSGYAVKDGFKLFGSTNLPPELIYQAAQIGLERLKSGEKHLAIHNRCGSSLLITNFLFAVLIIAAFMGTKIFKLSYLLIALVVINFLAKPLGRLTQRWITTSTDVRNIVITQLEVRTPAGNPFLRYFYREFFIATEQRQPERVFTRKTKPVYIDVIPTLPTQ